MRKLPVFFVGNYYKYHTATSAAALEGAIMDKLKVSVVLATYNEKDNIVHIIDSVIKNLEKDAERYDYELVVVDDSSPDGTSDAVRKKYTINKRVKLITRAERGLATALRRGIEESSGDVIAMMDTDFSHDPSQLSDLIKLAWENGASNGSRFMTGGRFVGKKYRSVVTKLLQVFARIVLGVPATDFTNGFVAVRKDVLKRLDINRIFFGYGDYCIRLFYYAHKKGVRIAEVPSSYKPRVYGQSKTRELKTGLQYVANILKLRFGL